MKQKLMAAAIAGALAAPGLALAQATNVQMYGVMDLRIHTESYSGSGPQDRKYGMHTGQPNRIGFRGTESLGGGLTAFFQVEQQVGGDARKAAALENGGNYLWGGRPTFLGLRGGWGEVSFGLQDSSYKDVGNVWNAVLTNNHTNIIMGHSSATGAAPNPNCIIPGVSQATGAIDATSATQPNGCGGDLTSSATSFNRTISNSIKYITPVIAGFRFSTLLEVPDYNEPATTSSPGGIAGALGSTRYEPRSGAMALTWTGGPFSAGAGWERHQGYRASNTSGTNRSAEDIGWTLGGKWNFGVGQLGVGFEQLKYENSGTALAANNFKIRNYVVNGQFRVLPNGVVSAAYSWTPGARDCGAGTPATGIVPTGGNVACGSAGKAKVMTVSYDHLLSKRTTIYATAGRIDNGSGSNYYYFAGPLTNSNNGTTSGLARGQDATMVATGVKHSF
jgi:predicted porin